MKKYISLLLCLILTLSLCSCGLIATKGPALDDSSKTDSTSSEQSSETETPSQVESKDEGSTSDDKNDDKTENKTEDNDKKPQIVPGSVPVTVNKTYYYTNDSYFSSQYRPNLTLNADRTFVLVENLAEGMGTYTGTFTLSKATLTLNVTKVDFMGFSGDNVKTIIFTVNNAHTLTIQTQLCLTGPGAVFKID